MIARPIAALALVLCFVLCMSSSLAAAHTVQWGSDLTSSAKKIPSDDIKKYAGHIKDFGSAEADEQAARTAADALFNSNEASSTGLLAGRVENIVSLMGGAQAAMGTDAEAAEAHMTGDGELGANQMANLQSTGAHDLHQTEDTGVTNLLKIEDKAQASLQKTMEALVNIREDGIMHIKRRGDEAEETLNQGDREHANQIIKQTEDSEWKLEQRALRTETRLDRMLQQTRDLLRKKDEADEARAASLEAQLDQTAHSFETRLVQRQAKAALLRLARERLAEQELSTQRAKAHHQSASLLNRPKAVNAQLRWSTQALQSKMARAFVAAQRAHDINTLLDARASMRRAARRGALTAHGAGSLIPDQPAPITGPLNIVPPQHE